MRGDTLCAIPTTMISLNPAKNLKIHRHSLPYESLGSKPRPKVRSGRETEMSECATVLIVLELLSLILISCICQLLRTRILWSMPSRWRQTKTHDEVAPLSIRMLYHAGTVVMTDNMGSGLFRSGARVASTHDRE